MKIERMTQKEIRNLVADITYLSFDDCNALRNSHKLTTLNVSTGVYGMNGALGEAIRNHCPVLNGLNRGR